MERRIHIGDKYKTLIKSMVEGIFHGKAIRG